MTPLEQLLETLDAASAPGDAPMWIHAHGHAGDGGVLAVDRVMERMYGWTAPEECWAVGVVADAWARPLVDPGPGGLRAAPGDGERQRVRTRCLVSRHGEVVSRLHLADGRVVEDRPSTGRTLDAMHRCVGLPTPPPERPSSDLLTLVWLAEILAAAGVQGAWRRRISWPEAVGVHPAVRALQEDGHEVPLDHVEQVLAAAGRAWSWSRLRELASGGSWLSDLVPAGLAGWMDDGMFSRWVLGSAPPLLEVLAEVRAAVPVPVGRQLQRCLAGAGIVAGAA